MRRGVRSAGPTKKYVASHSPSVGPDEQVTPIAPPALESPLFLPGRHVITFEIRIVPNLRSAHFAEVCVPLAFPGSLVLSRLFMPVVHRNVYFEAFLTHRLTHKGMEVGLELNLGDEELFDEWESWSIKKKIKAATVEHLEKFRSEMVKSNPSSTKYGATAAKKVDPAPFHFPSSISHSGASRSSMDVDVAMNSGDVNTKKRSRASLIEEAKSNSVFSQRTNRGRVEASYAGIDASKFTGKSNLVVSIDLHDNWRQFEQGYRWNYNSAGDISSAMDSRVSRLSSALLERNPDLEGAIVGVIATGTENSSRIDRRDVCLLQHDPDSKSSRGVRKLDLLAIENVSLFRGQVVVVDGVNNGPHTRYIAQSVYSIANPDAQLLSDAENVLRSRELHLMIGAGPFTAKEDLSYEPLTELLRQVKVRQPHVLVLVGPFVDEHHPMIQAAATHLTFEQIHEGVMTKIEEYLAGIANPPRVIVLPSLADVTHQCVLPQPSLPPTTGTKFSYFPNPCMFTVNALQFGITSVDVLHDLEQNSIISGPQTSDLHSSLASFVLNQQSFYPIYPAPSEVPVDMPHSEAGLTIPSMPDALIFASTTHSFVRTINGVLAINVGKTITHGQPGTFAEVKIAQSAQGASTSLVQRTLVEIVRI